jgi:hypothetical protein
MPFFLLPFFSVSLCVTLGTINFVRFPLRGHQTLHLIIRLSPSAIATMTALLATSSQFGYGDSPRVLIVGAGLAGLFLGNLLEKANIPYEIFERAATIKPLGEENNKRRLLLMCIFHIGDATNAMPLQKTNFYRYFSCY